jgi:hypothetical protein
MTSCPLYLQTGYGVLYRCIFLLCLRTLPARFSFGSCQIYPSRLLFNSSLSSFATIFYTWPIPACKALTVNEPTAKSSANNNHGIDIPPTIGAYALFPLTISVTSCVKILKSCKSQRTFQQSMQLQDSYAR